MGEQTNIKWQQKTSEIQIQILVSNLRANKESPTLIHVQITSPKYCTLNLVPLVTCA